MCINLKQMLHSNVFQPKTNVYSLMWSPPIRGTRFYYYIMSVKTGNGKKEVKWRLYEYAKYTICELYNFIAYNIVYKNHKNSENFLAHLFGPSTAFE